MRWVLLALLLFAFAPSRAEAAEAPAPAPVEDEAPMAPEDWIPVAGIACYIVIPAILVIIGVVAYTDWVRRNTFQAQEALVLPLRPPPPRGLVLFRF